MQAPCGSRRARRRLLRHSRCLSLSLSRSRSCSRSRSHRQMRRQGRLRSTRRPRRHRPSIIASSITLPSCSSTAGSKVHLGSARAQLLLRLRRALPPARGSSALPQGEEWGHRASNHCPQSQPPSKLPSNYVWPPREQQQQLLQAQLAAAAVQQETQQRLRQARKALVNTAHPRISPCSQQVMDPHLSFPA